MTGIGSVLNQIFRPAAYQAHQTAKAMAANPSDAIGRISQLLTAMGNRQGDNFGAGSNGALRAQSALSGLVDAGSFLSAKMTPRGALDCVKEIQKDMRAQCLHIRNSVGGASGWNQDRCRDLKAVEKLAADIRASAS